MGARLTGLRRGFSAALLIAAVSAAGYYPSLTAPFQYDDLRVIAENPLIKNPLRVRDIFFFNPARFVTYFSLSVNYAFSGDPVYYHFTNFLIHAINCFLVYLLLLEFFKRDRYETRMAVLGACLFAVHPVHTQAVTLVVNRSELLCAFFYALSVILLLRRAHYLVICLMFLLSLFSKEIGITLPVTALLVEQWRKKCEGRETRGPDIQAHACLWLITFVYLACRQGGLGFTTAVPPEHTSWQNLMTQARAVPAYLGLLVFPAWLNIDHDFPVSKRPDAAVVFCAAAILLAVLAAAYVLFTSRPGSKKAVTASFGILWFFAVLAPSSGIVPIADTFVEHRLYLPSIGLLVFAASIATGLLEKTGALMRHARILKRVFFFAGACAIGAGMLAASARNKVWGSAYSLWKDAALKSPYKSRPHLNLGQACLSLGLYPEAEQELKLAIEISSGNAVARGNLATLYAALGREDAALAEYENAIALAPQTPQFYANLGNLYAGRDPEKAIKVMQEGIRRCLDPSILHFELGNLFFDRGDYREAVKSYRKAMSGDPYDARTVVNYANALVESGVPEAAEDFYLKALEIDPGLAEAYVGMGLLRFNEGREKYADAERFYLKAIELDAHCVKARNNLGVVYGTLGLKKEAVAEWKKALILEPGNAEARQNLEMMMK